MQNMKQIKHKVKKSLGKLVHRFTPIIFDAAVFTVVFVYVSRAL